MRASDLPSSTDYATPADGYADTPADSGMDLADVYCKDGWVVELRSSLGPGQQPGMVGLHYYAAQTCLADAVSDAQDHLDTLVQSGAFVALAEGAELEMLPHALGEVTDADGHVLEVEQD